VSDAEARAAVASVPAAKLWEAVVTLSFASTFSPFPRSDLREWMSKGILPFKMRRDLKRSRKFVPWRAVRALSAAVLVEGKV
jgi:hypothetical protein